MIPLTIAILFEVAGTTCMKLSEGFTKLTPSILGYLFYGICLAFLNLSLKTIDVSTAYAIWCGAGIALIAVIGMTYFRESITPVKIIGLLLIIAGVVALRLKA
jgi:small multidrug resistance pump